MNVSKKGAFFKGLFFLFIAFTCLFAKSIGLADPGDKWQYVGVIIGVIAAIGYFKKCFERRR